LLRSHPCALRFVVVLGGAAACGRSSSLSEEGVCAGAMRDARGQSIFFISAATHRLKSLVIAKQLFYVCQMPSVDVEARRAALALLMRGKITVAEARLLAGVSRQLMHYWIERAGINPARVRHTIIKDIWRRELKHGAKLVEEESKRSGSSGKDRRAADHERVGARRAAALER